MLRLRCTLALLLLLLPACRTSSDEAGERQYRPYCVTEKKPLAPWTADREEADTAIREHTRLYHWHTTRLNLRR